MKVNDNYLKEQLKHVYWLNGGCCAGKTTMTKKFVQDLGFQTLGDDVLKYRPFASPDKYPALQYPHPGLDWDKWFNRPIDEHCEWLFQIVEEMMEFFVIDLLKMPTHTPIIIDLGIMPEQILSFIPKERMICLYTSDAEMERLYFFREDHKMILDVINLTADPAETIKNGNKSMVKFSHDIRNACVKKGIKTIERTTSLSVEEQFRLVREHFGF
ncbi:MAG: AAA family ATPase [Paenibacillus sp.]|nr:AAA family ATPase [Paenibacillus sp.]